MNLKKPKFWDYEKPNLYAYLLFPISIIIRFISFLNTKLKIKNTKIKTICVGNIYIGGTGKTSLAIKINEILNKKGINSCFIKKFYANQTDEQKILKKKGRLFLSSKRSEAIKEAEKENYDMAIFDDGLQDKTINYDNSFVCFNTINWIGNGMTIPAGPLREKISNLKKYKNIFLNGNLENIDLLKRKILKINSNLKIFVGVYEPLNLQEFDKNENYLVFSGIGNHETFIAMLRASGLKILKNLEFPDHYNYNQNDIKKILDEANNFKCKIITTEKDYLRTKIISLNKIKYIKSELRIIDEEKLLHTIL